MTPEQQKALALASARRRRQKTQPAQAETTINPAIPAQEANQYSAYTPVREALEGATLGLGDEIQAGISALGAKGVDKVQSLLGGQEVLADKSLPELYTQSRDELRGEGKAFTQTNPKTALALELGGALTTGGGGAAKTLGKQGLKALMKYGAKTGAAAGFGYSEKDSLPGLAVDTAVGAGMGAGIGAAQKPVGTLMKKGSQALGRQITKAKDSTLEAARNLGYKG